DVPHFVFYNNLRIKKKQICDLQRLLSELLKQLNEQKRHMQRLLKICLDVFDIFFSNHYRNKKDAKDNFKIFPHCCFYNT
ncbi:hypothetical protein BpHYR1_000887, partial [Brachionus plicatilis]